MNACPIIDRVTRPFSPSSAPNDEGSELCVADGWVDEGWKHVTMEYYLFQNPKISARAIGSYFWAQGDIILGVRILGVKILGVRILGVKILGVRILGDDFLGVIILGDDFWATIFWA